jgi:peroxiredoxin
VILDKDEIGENMAEDLDLSVGAEAIDFTLMGSDDNEISLSSFQGKSNVYLFFIREYN